jgi:hypothetical protein
MIWQGWHHSAQKSTTAGSGARSTCSAKVASVTATGNGTAHPCEEGVEGTGCGRPLKRCFNFSNIATFFPSCFSVGLFVPEYMSGNMELSKQLW